MNLILMDLSNRILFFRNKIVIVILGLLYGVAKWMLSPAITAVVLNHYLNAYPSIDAAITSAIHQIPPIDMIPTLIFPYSWFIRGPVILYLSLTVVSHLIWLIADSL